MKAKSRIMYNVIQHFRDLRSLKSVKGHLYPWLMFFTLLSCSQIPVWNCTISNHTCTSFFFCAICECKLIPNRTRNRMITYTNCLITFLSYKVKIISTKLKLLTTTFSHPQHQEFGKKTTMLKA